jgi:predicted nucleic acid-binding protein
MSHFSAVLDTNVLYGAYLRDILLDFAAAGFFNPRWSDQITTELVQALLRKFPDSLAKQESTITALNAIFPDARIAGYEQLIDNLHDTDTKDRHVLAAALAGKADAIVTFNLKDFPARMESKYGVKLLHPDDCLSLLVNADHAFALEVMGESLARYKRPELNAREYLAIFQKAGCPGFAEYIALNLGEVDAIARK